MRSFFIILLFVFGSKSFAQEPKIEVKEEVFEGSAIIRVYLFPGGMVEIKAPIIHSKISEDQGRFSVSRLEVEVSKMDSGLELRDIEIKKILGQNQKIIASEVLAFKGTKKKIGSAFVKINQIEKKIPFKFILMGLTKLKATMHLKLSDFKISPPEYMGAKVKNEMRIIAYLNFEPSKVEVKAKRHKRTFKVKKSSKLKH